MGPLVQDTVDAFMLSRRVANCSAATLSIYEANLSRFARVVGRATLLADVGPLAIQHYLIRLRETVRPISADQHDRNLRTFFRWAVGIGLLTDDPMRGIPRPRVPLPLPDLPSEDELRAVLASCTPTFEGVRNRAIILVMADAGLRAPTSVDGQQSSTARSSSSVGTWGSVEGVLIIMPASGARFSTPVVMSQRQKVFRVLKAW